jgi:hypothetical protein
MRLMVLPSLVLTINLFAFAAPAENFMAFSRMLGPHLSGGAPRAGDATWGGTAAIGAGSPASFQVPSFEANFLATSVHTPVPTAGLLASTSVVSVTGPLAPGTLAAGVGPGSFVFNPPSDPVLGTRYGTMQVIAGPNQFGGTVAHGFRVLDQLTINFGARGIYAGTIPLSQIVGVFTPPGATRPTQSYTGTLANTSYSASTSMVFVRANFAPWTTGVAIARDAHGGFASTSTQTGYDNRTANGRNGTVQMVSPYVIALKGDNLGENTISGVHRLRYEFLPEPRNTQLLVVGILGLLLIACWERPVRR